MLLGGGTVHTCERKIAEGMEAVTHLQLYIKEDKQEELEKLFARTEDLEGLFEFEEDGAHYRSPVYLAAKVERGFPI